MALKGDDGIRSFAGLQQHQSKQARVEIGSLRSYTMIPSNHSAWKILLDIRTRSVRPSIPLGPSRSFQSPRRLYWNIQEQLHKFRSLTRPAAKNVSEHTGHINSRGGKNQPMPQDHAQGIVTLSADQPTQASQQNRQDIDWLNYALLHVQHALYYFWMSSDH